MADKSFLHIVNRTRFFRSLSLALAVLCVVFCLTSCKTPGESENTDALIDTVDFASELKLDMSSDTVKQEVTVHTFVDGDTTHFNVPTSVMPTGILKARYIAINTPESTGKVEEYGKEASNFTRQKLEGAVSILVESDTSSWDADSTGGRYLVWVWYKTASDTEYRNLNVEILQNGLAIASSSANNRYGSICTSAIAQAKAQKLNLYSGKRAEGFYYGDAIELTLKELRCNISDYNGKKVAFEGVITKNNSNSVYIEELDAETGMYFGISVYYGYSLTGEGLEILSVGNRSRIVGTVQYYEAGGTYQVSGLTYRAMKPDDAGNIKKISDGHLPAFVKVNAETFTGGRIQAELDDSVKEYPWAELAMNTSLSMDKLTVKKVYTTQTEGSSSFGAMTLTCEADGIEISVRTVPLFDESGKLITSDAYKGKTINVKGLVDCFDGKYQIKVFSKNDITICN